MTQAAVTATDILKALCDLAAVNATTKEMCFCEVARDAPFGREHSEPCKAAARIVKIAMSAADIGPLEPVQFELTTLSEQDDDDLKLGRNVARGMKAVLQSPPNHGFASMHLQTKDGTDSQLYLIAVHGKILQDEMVRGAKEYENFKVIPPRKAN